MTGPGQSRRLLIAAAGALALAGAAAAQPELQAQPEDWIVTVASDPARCNLARARRVALAALARDYAAMIGRCVAVRGYWRSAGLFRRARDARGADALYRDGMANRRIGLYGTDEVTRLAPRRSARAVTAVGSVESCEHLRNRGTMMLGYCHNRLAGPVLALAAVYPDR